MSSLKRRYPADTQDDSQAQGPKIGYVFDEIDPNTLVQASRYRYEFWPQTTFEALAWLIELCKFARSYHGACALMELGVLNSLITNYFRYNAPENASQSMLILLLCTLCFRVKESVYLAGELVSAYGLFFSRLIKSPQVSWLFLSRLNARYEFNAYQVQELIPIIYSCYTQPHMNNYVRIEKRHFGSHVHLDVPDVAELDRYRAHVKSAYFAYDANQGLQSRVQELEVQLQDELGYPPTLGNLAINCMEMAFALPSALPAVFAPIRNFIAAFSVGQTQQIAGPPQLYSLIKELFIAKALDESQQAIVLADLRVSLAWFLQDGSQPPSLPLKLELLKVMPRKDMPEMVALYTHFSKSERSHELTECNCLVWQLIKEDHPELIEGAQVPVQVDRFLQSARYNNYERYFPQ